MSSMMTIFSIMVLGYALGRVSIKGISLGTSGVLLIALVFGHFGFVAPSNIKNFGLITFVAAVGVIAGPVFFDNFKRKAISYIILGLIIILLGAGCCVGIIKCLNIPKPLALGLMNGALTSTPGLAAALEATGNDPLASVGYGIAYPFGVLGVVLFVQLMPRLLKVNLEEEAAKLTAANSELAAEADKPTRLVVDEFGFFPYALAISLGVLLGKISIPLPGGASFALGSSGGPLITGLIIGAIGHIGPASLTPEKSTMKTMRELGLALFLLGAGTEAGSGFVAVVQQYGWSLFFAGAIITLIPMVIGYFVAVKLMKVELLSSLGAICGGMTSTPALGTLIALAKTDVVAAAYAATYPIALVMVVLSSQFIGLLL